MIIDAVREVVWPSRIRLCASCTDQDDEAKSGCDEGRSRSHEPKHIDSLGVKISTDLSKTLKWCDALNILRIQNERMDLNYFPSTREYTQNFGLTSKRLKAVKKDIVILHPGPINRGVEISSEVADSDQSIILDQVENGVAIRMAIIYLLASKLNISIT